MRRRLLVALGSLLAALLLAEVALRRWYPVGRPTYRLDATLLHEPIPGSRRIQPMPEAAGGARNLIALNAHGYRGPALEQPKTRRRLAVVGDSFVMAENVAYPASFPARLAAHLGGRWETVSMGASGYGPDQALLRLEREFGVLQPDLVLLVLCATNDHGDVVRNKLFGLDQGGRLRRRRPRVGPVVVAQFELAAARGDDLALVRLVRALRRTRAYEAQLEREARSEPPDYMGLYLQAAAREWEDHESGDPLVRDLLRDYYDADLALAPASPSARGKRALMAALMGEWVAAMRARKTPLLVLVVPSAVDLDPTFHIRVDPQRFPDYDPRAQTEALLEAASGAGAAVRGLFDLFVANDPARLFVGVDDIHWTARGMDLAAQEVAGWMQGLGY